MKIFLEKTFTSSVTNSMNDPVEISVSCSYGGYSSQQEIWDSRLELEEKISRRKEDWNKMSEEQKTAVTNFVRKGLENLYNTVDDWMPEAVESKPGTFLNVDFRIVFASIEEEIDAANQKMEIQIQKTKQEIANKLIGKTVDLDKGRKLFERFAPKLGLRTEMWDSLSDTQQMVWNRMVEYSSNL